MRVCTPFHHIAGAGTMGCSTKIDLADCFSQKNNGSVRQAKALRRNVTGV
jgi:hypothetical protein